MSKDIERLIDDLELCHHKAERHVKLIVEAIASGSTDKGADTREEGARHPAEDTWQNAIDVLSAWLDEEPERAAGLSVGPYSGGELSAMIGEHTPLKDWQVGQAIRKLKAASRMYSDAEYREMVEYPEAYADAREFRDMTAATVIKDTRDRDPAEISLAAMIDHLQPCNWNFPENLVIVLKAINGDLAPDKPFAAHARNVCWNPVAGSLRITASTLRDFCGDGNVKGFNYTMLQALGEKTPEKTRLARLLEKKISEVFDPNCLPPELEPLWDRLESLEAMQQPNVELRMSYFPWVDLFYECEDYVRGGIELSVDNDKRRAGIGMFDSEFRVCAVDHEIDGPGLFGALPDEDSVVKVMEAFAAEGVGAAVEAFEKLRGKRPGGE